MSLPFYHLGLFSDFFHWISTFFGSVINSISKFINGINAIYVFITQSITIIITVTGWIPAVLSALILLAIGLLIVKLIVGR